MIQTDKSNSRDLVPYAPPIASQVSLEERVASACRSFLEFHCRAAETEFIATYKAVHLGGTSTQESKLILSFLRSVENELFEEIHKALSKHFDLHQTPICSITLVSEPGRRNRIFRIAFKNSERSVIFKESRPEQGNKTLTDADEKAAFDRFARDWAGLEFTGRLQPENRLCPQCYGGNEEDRFVLMEDLGKDQVTLADHLLKGSASAAQGSLERYLSCLGQFHATGHGRINEYLEVLHKINPQAPLNSQNEMIHKTLSELRPLLARLNIPFTELMEEEIKTVIRAVSDPEGPFGAVIHGDPCPDNVFDYPEKLLLIDFEWASVGSALLDATYPRMSMPTGWCAGKFPEEGLDTAEAIYRNELTKLVPAATDDRAYFDAYAQACAMHVLNTVPLDIQEVNEVDRTWGIASIRSRVLSRLETFIQISAKHETLPALRSMATQMLESLTAKWEESKPLDLYPAFGSAPLPTI